ncbi:MAG TPA: diacylglycerol kinase family protein [Candidatus Hydrogenedentes bacterium]|nr:diacylglycerol kinase family protein [Candidatus Hydrogenedentota bacterium]HOT49778.1 diacylglycerol kinase family protein [Candidatus Hydrogenedentota bacterium]HOV74243.1 diacylglycerol kinase family protein [Candidatus Hydrogenedentota bacterium]HPC15063.1 diacylglycerol kinase family protein [Candidatus Hydrogenedentota bacterium]HRT19076.1 diacylglycerol kinase family protein [Candidatus Hydrogenedentota bacterium]
MDLRRLAPAERLRSLGYALRGIAHVFHTQPNAWIMAMAAAVVFMAGIFFHVDRIEWALLASAVFLVLVAETINTAIEHLTDLASPERHPLAGHAKDAAAGAVLLAVIFSVLIAAIVFGTRFAGIVRHLL